MHPMTFRPARLALLSMLTALIYLPAQAQQSNLVPAARLAATCANCHGTNGFGVGDKLPKLAGQSHAALLSAMQAFKSGSRPASVMHQIMKGYTDSEIAELAVFFAEQKK